MTAIHHGHALRPQARELCALTPGQRLREEDPYTGGWTGAGDLGVVVHHSRFEVDLNRTLARCVYLTPADGWGLSVWRTPPSRQFLAESQAIHQRFYREMACLLDGIMAERGGFALLDIHSYNHRRQGPAAPPADLAGNPDIDLLIPPGERQHWAGAIAAFKAALSTLSLAGHPPTIGENTRFQRAAFGDWVAHRYGAEVLVLVVEFKKIFMDEWSGVPCERSVGDIGRGLAAGVAALRPFFPGKVRQSVLT